MKNKGYAKFAGGSGEGQIRCIMGDVQVAYYGSAKLRSEGRHVCICYK